MINSNHSAGAYSRHMIEWDVRNNVTIFTYNAVTVQTQTPFISFTVSSTLEQYDD